MRVINHLTRLLGMLAGIAVGLMMIHVVADVFAKYFLHMPVPSTAEVVANYYMIACVFLPLAYIEARGTAISVDLIYEQVNPTVQRLMCKIGQLATLLFYMVLGWFSWDVAIRAYQVSETVDGLWRVTIWPAKFLLPIGLVIACLILLLKIFEQYHDWNDGDLEYSQDL